MPGSSRIIDEKTIENKRAAPTSVMGGLFIARSVGTYISARALSGVKHRVEGQHLHANRNHQCSALNGMPHCQFLY